MNSCGVLRAEVSQERVEEVSNNCWAIIDELSKAGQFVSIDKVLTVLLQRYGVFDFSQLMCGELSNVPIMALLSELNRKVDTFLSTSFAMASIVTLADLDWECAQYLQCFEIPSLHSVQPKKASCRNVQPVSVDPNEVDLEEASIDQPDDTESVKDNTIEQFEDYGVGLLLHHPVVWSYFGGYVSAENSADWCSHEKVLQILIEFLSEQKWQQNSNKFSSFSVDEFIEYLCAELSISHPAEAGILIRGNLHAERIALEHVVKNRYTLYVETTKRELEHFNQQMQTFQGSGRKSVKKRRKRTAEEPEEPEEPDETTGASEAAADEDINNNGEGVKQVEQDEQNKQDKRDNEESKHINISIEENNAGCVIASEAIEIAPSNNVSAPIAAVAAAPASTREKRKVLLTSNPPPYETSMNVYLPSGLPSITSNGAFKAGISYCGDADPGIRIVENWELQPILPYIDINSNTNIDMDANKAFTDTPWVQNSAINTFNSALDGRAAGRWGEALVYQYLLATATPGSKVNWLNLTEESRACYDFIVTAPVRSHHAQFVGSRTHYNQDSDNNTSISMNHTTAGSGGRESTEYIEVKSTRFADRNVFEISPNEWQFAAADSRVPYHVYRVFSAGDPQRVRLVIIEDIYRKVTEGRLKLCMAV
eukprot:gene14200-16325_t